MLSLVLSELFIHIHIIYNDCPTIEVAEILTFVIWTLIKHSMNMNMVYDIDSVSLFIYKLLK